MVCVCEPIAGCIWWVLSPPLAIGSPVCRVSTSPCSPVVLSPFAAGKGADTWAELPSLLCPDLLQGLLSRLEWPLRKMTRPSNPGKWPRTLQSTLMQITWIWIFSLKMLAVCKTFPGFALIKWLQNCWKLFFVWLVFNSYPTLQQCEKKRATKPKTVPRLSLFSKFS